MKSIFIAFIILTISSLCYSQTQISSVMNVSMYALNLKEETSASNVILNDPISVGFSDDFEAIEGGPYYNDKWLKGRVVLKNGQVLGGEWLFKYNIFQDELHVLLESKTVKIPIKNQIQSFMMEQDGKQHYFVNSAQTGIIGKEDNTFFEVLHSKRFTLLKKNSKHYGELKNDDFYCSTCKKSPFAFFFASAKYYVKDKKGQFKHLKLTRQSILNAFPKQKSLLISYWKNNKTKVKTEADLLETLEYIESSIATKK